MIERVAEFISCYSMFASRQRVGVAVSGGVDSVALLVVLHELAPRWALALSVLHLDHRLRGDESRRDAAFVRDLAALLGLPAHIKEVDVGDLARRSGDNLEQAARRARREFFLGFLEAGLVDRVALGHTRSDQAETVLFRFLRGSGTAGLAGIWPVTEEGFVRPLLAVHRSDVLTFLRQRGMAWREDPTNRDMRFARNRIRHHLLPELSADWNPSLPETLAQTAAVAQDEELYWKAEIDRLATRLLTLRAPAVLFRASEVGDLPTAVARRLLRRAIRTAKGDLRQVDVRHVEQILALARTPAGHGRTQVPGLDVMRSFEWVRLAPFGSWPGRKSDYSIPLSVPGRFPIPDSSSALCLELAEAPRAGGPSRQERKSGYNTSRGSELDWGRISAPLELRNWRPGDGFHVMGGSGERKLKTLFQDARVPSWDRAGWPIMTSGDVIVWARQFGVAQSYAATPQSHQVLRVWETEQ